MRIGAAFVALAAVPALIASTAVQAAPGCTKLAFSVNDYGKDGPTKDAKELLDKYIAKWAGEHGIKKYTTGKKDVSCELFFNLIVVDEHTCKASATVCWTDGPAQINAAAPAVKAKATAATTRQPAAKPIAAKPAAALTTGTVPAAAPAAAPAAPAPAAPAVVAPVAPAAPAAPAPAAPAAPEAPKQQ